MAEVGPIKYIGDMIYDVDDANALDKAVRLVIMLIMVVFDPLAVLLLIAANMSMAKRSGRPIVKDGEVVGLTPSDIPVFVPEKEKKSKVEVDKENIAEISKLVAEETLQATEPNEEKVEPIKIPEDMDPVTGQPQKKRGFPNRKGNAEKLEPKYDYDAEFAFKQKGNDNSNS